MSDSIWKTTTRQKVEIEPKTRAIAKWTANIYIATTINETKFPLIHDPVWFFSTNPNVELTFEQAVAPETRISINKQTPLSESCTPMARFTMEAIRNRKTIREIFADQELHLIPVIQWNKQLLDGGIFPSTLHKKSKEQENSQTNKVDLLQQIVQLNLELELLKKS